jgi:protein involved in polysaccharide export with SLBB domain
MKNNIVKNNLSSLYPSPLRISSPKETNFSCKYLLSSKLIWLILLLSLSTSFLAARSEINIADEYIVRPGDLFYIRMYSPIINTDPEVSLVPLEPVVPVTITGHLIVYPLTSPIKIAGYTLAEAQEKIKTEIRKSIPNGEIFIDLYSINPYSIHILGAVNQPGEFIADTLVTLYQSLQLALGLSPAASKKISLTRNNETRVYDLNRYLKNGDLSENPLILSDDLIKVDFAEEFAKVYIVTDSVNYVEYFEMETDKQVAELLPLIKKKHAYTDYFSIFLSRDGEMNKIAANTIVKAGDSIYLNPEESYIYVSGQVNTPGRFTFVAQKGPKHYIALAGGVSRIGSHRTVYIVSGDGERVRYRGQELKEGDSIVIPVSIQTWFIDYLTPISSILSIVATIVVLTR